MKNSTVFDNLVQELENQLLSNEEQVMLLAGEGQNFKQGQEINNCTCFGGNNCECMGGNNCICHGLNNCTCHEQNKCEG